MCGENGGRWYVGFLKSTLYILQCVYGPKTQSKPEAGSTQWNGVYLIIFFDLAYNIDPFTNNQAKTNYEMKCLLLPKQRATFCQVFITSSFPHHLFTQSNIITHTSLFSLFLAEVAEQISRENNSRKNRPCLLRVQQVYVKYGNSTRNNQDT